MPRPTDHPCQICDHAPAQSLGESVVLCGRCIRQLRTGCREDLVKALGSPRTPQPLTRAQAANLTKVLIEVHAGARASAAAAAGGDPTHHLPGRYRNGWEYGEAPTRVAAWFDDTAVHLTVGEHAAIMPLSEGWTPARALVVLRRLSRAAGVPD